MNSHDDCHYRTVESLIPIGRNTRDHSVYMDCNLWSQAHRLATDSPRIETVIQSGDSLEISLAGGGGSVARLEPVKTTN